MKTATQIVLVLIFTILFHRATGKAEPLFQRIDLSANWAFSEAGTRNGNRLLYPARYTPIYIKWHYPPSFYGCNEKNLQWIGEKDWIYKTSFSVDFPFYRKTKFSSFLRADTMLTLRSMEPKYYQPTICTESGKLNAESLFMTATTF